MKKQIQNENNHLNTAEGACGLEYVFVCEMENICV